MTIYLQTEKYQGISTEVICPHNAMDQIKHFVSKQRERLSRGVEYRLNRAIGVSSLGTMGLEHHCLYEVDLFIDTKRVAHIHTVAVQRNFGVI